MWTLSSWQAVRVFRREPGFAAAVVLTLALATGAGASLFAVFEAVLLRPLPFDAAGELVVLRHRDVPTGLTKPDIAIGDFIDLRARQQSFESLAGFGAFNSTLFDQGEPSRIEGAVVTPDALEALRLRAAAGRLLQEADAAPRAAPVVLVSEDLWRTRFGSDPALLGRSIRLGDVGRQVVGVLPAGFRFPGMPRTDVVVPASLPAAAPAQRRNGWIYGLGRLRPGTTVEAAGAELAALSREFEAAHPQQNQGSLYEAVSLRDALVGDTRRPLLLLLAAVVLVQLIACVNVGNLLLARALGRQRELSIRQALGAGRWRLLGQVLAEGVALALAGSAAGLAVAALLAPVLAALVPDAELLPGLERVGLDLPVVLFALGSALVSAIVFSGIGCAGLFGGAASLLAGERRGTLSPRAGRAASALVVGEIALAVVLLAGAGLTLRSFSRLLAVDTGFTPAGVLTADVALPAGQYRDAAAREAFYARAFEAIAALPGVETVGVAMVTPLTGNNWTVPLQRADRPAPAGQRPPEVGWQLASAGYFRALKIPLKSGRLFEPADATGPQVVVISESVATRFFPGEHPVGRRVRLGSDEAEIVGVVGDIRRASLVDDPRADLYFPFERVNSQSTTMFVRTSGEASDLLTGLRAAIRQIEPYATVDRARTLTEIAEASAAPTQLAMRLLAGFAILALVLAVLGVYAVMLHRVGRRTRELGTRLALGASPRHLTSLVLRQAAMLAGLGVACGTAAAIACALSASSMLFDVPPWDPLTLAAVATVLLSATLAASYIPARRAGRVDPAAALGAE